MSDEEAKKQAIEDVEWARTEAIKILKGRGGSQSYSQEFIQPTADSLLRALYDARRASPAQLRGTLALAVLEQVQELAAGLKNDVERVGRSHHCGAWAEFKLRSILANWRTQDDGIRVGRQENT